MRKPWIQQPRSIATFEGPFEAVFQQVHCSSHFSTQNHPSVPSPAYSTEAIEKKWYAHWLKHDVFQAQPDPHKVPYTVVMPPPNITGVLHMGHILNNTVQDVLVRRARMQGKMACWVPGLDHASIATEAKVVALLKSQGIAKNDLSREEFLEHVWAWKEKHGSVILHQLQRLGVSCDWNRAQFTMDPRHSRAVVDTFVRLYEQGCVYRDTRMVYWDPEGQTTLSEDEVQYKSVSGKLYYIRYNLAESDAFIEVATTRPETLFGDAALCVHPNDKRHQSWVGRHAVVPLTSRCIPIIADPYVDPDFGTGCLKITPAHDMNDYALGKRHNLPFIEVLEKDGKLSAAAGSYAGVDRFVARKRVVQALGSQGCLVKSETHVHNVGFSERTHAAVEPRLSTQWFVRMSPLAQPALEEVERGKILFYPKKFKNMYRAWLTQVRDWCVSRQLWWGHRIPAYYTPDGRVVVARSPEDALRKAQAIDARITALDLRQDEDVLDTWFSSWLWPLSVFDGILAPENAQMRYFYPTQDLVTAPEIIFFWVARMIMAGKVLQQPAPFQNVYFTGIVRDKQGRKMSKSLGNSPDPLELIDQYGADGVRVGMLLSAPAGNDLLFDQKHCRQGRNFAHKLWNAFCLIDGWKACVSSPPAHAAATAWFTARQHQALTALDHQLAQFRLSEALMTLYKLVWDDFCARFLEFIKPNSGAAVDATTYRYARDFLGNLLKMLHPFMPFITEELWDRLHKGKPSACLAVTPWPVPQPYNAALLQQAEPAFGLMVSIRNLRGQHRIPAHQPIALQIQAAAWPNALKLYARYIQKMARLCSFTCLDQQPKNALTFQSGQYICHAMGVGGNTDADAALQKELDHLMDFLRKIDAKLNNDRFIQQAPASVVALEQRKKRDVQHRITSIQNQLRS